jgi:molecular chaperone HtpG
MEFKTEIKQLLDLMIHSLYSHKEIFLREIISNASDAIDKARYESLTNSNILEGEKDWKIKITADIDKGTLMVSDNGIGMTYDEVIAELGTIARSGTKEFLELLKEKKSLDDPELIGQFGVGFYSSFMVADKVTVISRKAGTGNSKGVKWESSGEGSYTVDEIEKSGKGTDVILNLKEEEKKYLQEWEIRDVVKKYSDFIEHPVTMDVEREEESKIKKGEKVKLVEEETLNSMKAIWLKNRPDISETEYNEFYKHVSHDFSDPAKVIHYRAEGKSEFTSLLYIPSLRPPDILYKEYKVGPMLYVKRVKIMDHCEDLMPPYLRFIRGVVDSSDLPLNVSREILQNNRQIDTMKNSITKKVMDALGDMKKNEYEKYLQFYKEFGRVIKEGIHYDFSRKESIAELLLFPSTKTEENKYTTLKEYVEGMKDGQDKVYFITGATLEETLRSPYLEAFKEKDYEVLIMLDDIDDIIMSGLEYKGKKFMSVVKGEITLDKKEEEKKEEAGKKYRKLIDFIKGDLNDKVKDVRLSGRLKDSPCCLVSEETDMDSQMQNMLRSMGQEVPETKRTLEINPAHSVFEGMNTLFEKDSKDERLHEYSHLLYGQALLLEGSKPDDPSVFAKYVSKLMLENLKKSG